MKSIREMYYVLWTDMYHRALTINDRVLTYDSYEEAAEALSGAEGNTIYEPRLVVEYLDYPDENALVYCEHFYCCEKCGKLLNWDETHWITSDDGICSDCYDEFSKYCDAEAPEMNEEEQVSMWFSSLMAR